MAHYASFGNMLHCINLLNIGVYGGTLYYYGFDESLGILDPTWLQEGFCLPHGDTPFRTTHDYSGYVMITLAIAGLSIQQTLRGWLADNKDLKSSMKQADQMAFWALVGAFGHACGHFILANAKRYDFLPPGDVTFLDDLRQSTWFEGLYKAGPGYPLFWIPLVKTYMMNTAQNRVALVALVLNMVNLFVPSKFGFSYTQAVLFGGMSIDQLMLPRSQKNTFEYALWPILTTIPNGFFAWIECLTCTSNSLMKQHGHIVYDLYMVCSYTVFYMLCYCWNQHQHLTKKPKEI
jgi:hypothetical protein